MAYLSEHYYKMMRLVPEGNGKNIALRTQYHKDKIKSWWLDEDNFINNWARPSLQRLIDSEIDEMIDKAFNGADISVNLNIWH